MTEVFNRVCVHAVSVSVIFVVALHSRTRAAETLYETASIGETGLTYPEGVIPWRGHVIDPEVYTGAVFELTTPVITSRIGGHFVRRQIAGADFFGAIVRLTGSDDLPDSYDFSTPDVLGTTPMTFPATSSEVFGNLAIRLEAGWYAVVFASGRFGRNGAGASVITGTDYGSATYIAWVYQSNPVLRQWFYPASRFSGQRFVIDGRAVPEPVSSATFTMGVLLLVVSGRRVR